MPWKVVPMSEVRLTFVHHVESLNRPVAAACREFGISRKTGYKWLQRFRSRGGLESLADRSRRPLRSPQRTEEETEQRILEVRDRFGWGARKIRAFLASQPEVHDPLPSRPTVHAVLVRHGRVRASESQQGQLPQAFERSSPNELWQLDFKGPLEIARQRVCPLSVLDDHSRFLLTIRACTDLTMNTAWCVLWDVFGEFGLPEAILCDNAFSNRAQNDVGLSRFDSWLVRLQIHPIHGRAYHPQTQGKIERLHRTYDEELFPRIRRDALEHFDEDANRWRREVYNSLRPHEALGDLPPIARWKPSPRPRPATLPEPQYPHDADLRKVTCRGDIFWHNYRILAGKGLAGQHVRIEERDDGIAVFYAWKQVRLLARSQLFRDTVL